jgi:hypothetical protein
MAAPPYLDHTPVRLRQRTPGSRYDRNAPKVGMPAKRLGPRSLGVGSAPRAREDRRSPQKRPLKSGKSQGRYRILTVQTGQNAYGKIM